MIKCVVWDLDNTLWDGVVSEINEVVIKEEVLKLIKVLKKVGIVQTIASRNDANYISSILEKLEINSYFIYSQINWGKKSESIIKILKGLHIKPNDVVFVDDSRFERDEVKNSIPLINVLDTADLNSLYDIINIGEQFDTYEAKERINQYFTEEKRLIAKENFRGTEKDFMRSCNISVEVSVAIEDDLIRMKELVDRTNQLNSTGYRYSMNELKALVSDKNFIILIAYIRDTYGDYGRSGLLIIEKNREGYIINQLIISCRLMGKGIAQALLHVAYNRAVTDKINKLKCLFLRNEFNRQMILLFSTNHMTRSIGDNSTYELCVDEHTILKPEWLALIDHTLVCE